MKILAIRISALIALLLPGLLKAQTRIVVLPLQDTTHKADVADITEKIRKAVNNTPGFWTYPPDQFQANVARFGLRPEQLYNVKNQKDLADLLKVDAFLEGRIQFNQKFILNMGLREARSGALKVSKQYTYTNQFTDQLAAVLARDLLGAAPKAPAPVAAAPAAVGTAAAKPKPAQPAKTTHHVEPAAASSQSSSWASDRMKVYIGFPLLKNKYMLNTTNNVGEISSSGSYFPNIELGGEYFFLPYLGIQGNFSRGFISLDINNSAGGATSVDVALWQFGGDLVGRYLLAAGDRKFDFRAFLGYHILNYDVDPNSVLTSNKYRSPLFGVGARAPIIKVNGGDLGVSFEGGYRFLSSLSESPVSTGDGSVKGYNFAGGLYWFFYQRFFTDVGYTYLKYNTTFSGTPTRAVAAGATTSDTFSGFLLRVGWQP